MVLLDDVERRPAAGRPQVPLGGGTVCPLRAGGRRPDSRALSRRKLRHHHHHGRHGHADRRNVVRRCHDRSFRRGFPAARLAARRAVGHRPSLRRVRLSHSRPLRPWRLRPKPPDFDAVSIDRGYLRRADGSRRRLHLPVCPVRRLPDEDGNGQTFRRPRPRRHRPHAGRPGLKRRAGQFDAGHAQRQRGGQRGNGRHLHHPADEAGRLYGYGGRCHRGGRLLGRPDSAAGHGCRRLSDGGNHRHALQPDRLCRHSAVVPVRPGAVRRGSPGGRQTGPGV